MPLEESSISTELGTLLDKFGVERKAKVACLVLMRLGQIEMVFPSGLDNQTIGLVEDAILDALERHCGSHR